MVSKLFLFFPLRHRIILCFSSTLNYHRNYLSISFDILTLLYSFTFTLFLIQVDELGRILCNICNVVPGGVVCFFPSYDYEEFIYTRLSKSSVLQRIEKRKKVCLFKSFLSIFFFIAFLKDGVSYYLGYSLAIY